MHSPELLTAMFARLRPKPLKVYDSQPNNLRLFSPAGIQLKQGKGRNLGHFNGKDVVPSEVPEDGMGADHSLGSSLLLHSHRRMELKFPRAETT